MVDGSYLEQAVPVSAVLSPLAVVRVAVAVLHLALPVALALGPQTVVRAAVGVP